MNGQHGLLSWDKIKKSNVEIQQYTINKFVSPLLKLLFLLKKPTAAVRGCVMVKMDVTLLILLETKNSQPPEPLSPGPITTATTGWLQGTCPVSLGKVNPGCTEYRACRDTEGREKTACCSEQSTLWRNPCPDVNCVMRGTRELFLWELNKVNDRIFFIGCITVRILSFKTINE